jgi:hypothetical protein
MSALLKLDVTYILRIWAILSIWVLCYNQRLVGLCIFLRTVFNNILSTRYSDTDVEWLRHRLGCDLEFLTLRLNALCV